MLEIVAAAIASFVLAARALRRPPPAENTQQQRDVEWTGVREAAELTRQRALRQARMEKRRQKAAARVDRLNRLRPKDSPHA